MTKRLTLIGVEIDETTGMASLEVNGETVLTDAPLDFINRLTIEELQHVWDEILEEERGGER